ncbi:reverse transcriptase domain-containing protein [Tanacetum coccineum]
MIQQIQNNCQFHGLPGDDANKHLDKFLTVTQSIKQIGFPDDSLRLFLFPYSLTHHATAWFDRLRKNSIHTFEEMVSKFLSKYFPPYMVTKLRNDISNFRQLPDKSLLEAWERYKLSIDRFPNHNMLPVIQIETLLCRCEKDGDGGEIIVTMGYWLEFIDLLDCKSCDDGINYMIVGFDLAMSVVDDG